MTFETPGLSWPNKVYATASEALSDVPDGAIVNVDGFGGPGGMAHYLMTALRDQGAKGLTMISNTAGIARVARFGVPEGVTAIDHTILVENGSVRIGHPHRLVGLARLRRNTVCSGRTSSEHREQESKSHGDLR